MGWLYNVLRRRRIRAIERRIAAMESARREGAQGLDIPILRASIDLILAKANVKRPTGLALLRGVIRA